jgi:hypothetical protein
VFVRLLGGLEDGERAGLEVAHLGEEVVSVGHLHSLRSLSQ